MNNRARLSETEFLSARLRMVEEQLMRRGINDPAVLAAMRKIPRHEFVPSEDLIRAYGDHPLGIGYEQTISQPYIVASMTQELGLSADMRVLEIGTGCGYQTAVLAEIVKEVVTIELIEGLLNEAFKRLASLGYTNIVFRQGDGSLGWPEKAPFDAILVTAAAPAVPPALLHQLGDPGRMIIPVGRPLGNQELILIEKTHGHLDQRVLYGVRFVPLRTLSDESHHNNEREQ